MSFPESKYRVSISIFSLTMLGVFMRKTNDGIYILVNKKPYTTEVEYLATESYEKLPELLPGCKVEFDEKKIKLTEYADCTRCQMPLSDRNQKCECTHKEIISTHGELIKSGFKPYNSGLGLKVSLKCGEKYLHAVLFQGNVMYDIMKKFDVGNEVHFKAILLNSSGQNELVKIFHVNNFK